MQVNFKHEYCDSFTLRVWKMISELIKYFLRGNISLMKCFLINKII